MCVKGCVCRCKNITSIKNWKISHLNATTLSKPHQYQTDSSVRTNSKPCETNRSLCQMCSLQCAVKDDGGHPQPAESAQEHLHFLFMSNIKPSELLCGCEVRLICTVQGHGQVQIGNSSVWQVVKMSLCLQCEEAWWQGVFITFHTI